MLNMHLVKMTEEFSRTHTREAAISQVIDLSKPVESTERSAEAFQDDSR